LREIGIRRVSTNPRLGHSGWKSIHGTLNRTSKLRKFSVDMPIYILGGLLTFLALCSENNRQKIVKEIHNGQGGPWTTFIDMTLGVLMWPLTLLIIIFG